VHIEIQSQEQLDFAQRMYIYNYRAFDLYQKPVLSLAILGDSRPSWRPCSYGYNLGRFLVNIEFPMAKILDYEAQWETLSQQLNPFAIMVMAHLKTLATTGKPAERQQWKWILVRSLYEKGYNKHEIIKLFKWIDRMMGLPVELQKSFNETVKVYEEERKMPLLSRMEEMAIEQGLERGILQTLRESIITVLRVRLGELSPSLVESLNNQTDVPKLKQLLEIASTVLSVQEFEEHL